MSFTPPVSIHALYLAKECPACGVLAPMIERGWETCLGSMGPHDPNCVSGRFCCESGHLFDATTQYRCKCGWSGVNGCKISGHDKVRLLSAEHSPTSGEQSGDKPK